MAADPVRRRLGGPPLARGARRARPHRGAHRGMDDRVRHRRGATVDQHGRHRPHRRVDPRLRHPGPAADPPARDPRGRAGVVPALLRARGRQRPGRADHACGARRRRVGGHRPEGVVLQRAGRRPWHPPGPHRPRRAASCRHLVLPRRHALARHRGAPAAADDRRQRVRRGVPRRGAPARRRAAGPVARRVGGRDGHAHERARLHRLRRHLAGAPTRRHRRARRRRGCRDPRPVGRARGPRPGAAGDGTTSGSGGVGGGQPGQARRHRADVRRRRPRVRPGRRRRHARRRSLRTRARGARWAHRGRDHPGAEEHHRRAPAGPPEGAEAR